MRKTTCVLWGLVVLATGWMSGPSCWASGLDYAAQVKASESRYKTPEDLLLAKIPFLSDLPRTFLIGDGFKVKLSAQELRIDHMGTRSRAPAARRDCMIGVSYTTPVAGFFTSRIDLPLMHAENFRLAEWTRGTLGDYVAYFSRDAVENASVRFLVTAKF